MDAHGRPEHLDNDYEKWRESWHYYYNGRDKGNVFMGMKLAIY